MNLPAERLASYEDLIDPPDHVIGESLHGQLITQSRPAPRHARSASNIGGELATARDPGRGGWRHPGGTGTVAEFGHARVIAIAGVSYHFGLLTGSLDVQCRNAGTTLTGR